MNPERLMINRLEATGAIKPSKLKLPEEENLLEITVFLTSYENKENLMMNSRLCLISYPSKRLLVLNWS